MFSKSCKTRFAAGLLTWGSLSLCTLAQAEPPVSLKPSSAALKDSKEELDLTLLRGEQQVLPAQGVKTFSEGTEGIIDVRLTGDASRFVIVGKLAGTTSLLFLMQDGTERHYRVTVRDPNAETTTAQTPNKLTVDAKSNIRLDLYFVQLDRSYNHGVGMNMPATVGSANVNYAYDLTARSLISNSAVVGTELLPTLELAQTQGWAKINRHVAVITTNGTEATFDSGGEFNVAVSQGLNSTVQSITFGSILGVVPRYDEETKRMELKVRAEIADLAATSSEVPGRNRSTLNTIVNLALGESLSVAGLTATSVEEQKAGLFGLSQIPIVGVLFGKHTQKEKDTENVVFIVPSVVEPMKRARGKEFLESVLRQYEDYDGDLSKVKLMPTLEETEARGQTSANVSKGSEHDHAPKR